MLTNEVVNQAINYIMEHINEDIKIEDVADYCHFSKFYFSRIFKEETGESLYSFIKRVKMEQSAFRLKVERDKTITDISAEYGYSSSNYSSVFKQHHNISPVNFRKTILNKSINHPFFHKKRNHLETLEECKKKISIQTLDDYYVIYERRKGNYHNMGIEWCKFQEEYREYKKEDTVFIERTFDDPSITAIENCMYDICMSVDKDCELENTCIIKGGKFAIYHFSGMVQDIYAAYQTIFNVWFPQCNYEIDERYGFDIYHDIDSDTMHIVMDICLPIR